MLTEITIRDLALIDAGVLALDAGLNVLTGETGAGKSLLVTSLELLRGETPRGGAGAWIRRGAKEARVEGRFLIEDSGLAERVASVLENELPELALDWRARLAGGDAELILGRTLTLEGRTRAHVDQRPVTLRALRALAPLLLEIHGQNEHQRLLDPGEQRRLLDSFGSADQDGRAYRETRTHWLGLRERFVGLEAARQERRERLEFLRYQEGELEQAGLREGEREELVQERDLLRNASELRSALGITLVSLQAGDDSLLDRMQADLRTVEKWHSLVPGLAGVQEDLAAARIHLEEAAASLASLLDRAEDDPARLELVEDRLAELERLEHKYGTDARGLIRRRSEIAAELTEIEGDEESLATLQAEIALAEKNLKQRADALTKKRKAVAPRLKQAVEKAFTALGLGQASFEVVFVARAGEADQRFGPDGSSDVEFHLAANPGESAGPLRKVASGGETARIMLALRTVLCASDASHTLVFDEIDAGVGGRLGPAVASHLRELAAHHQVLCVTHLPAIAAQAHVHLLAAKEVTRGRTQTRVERLDGDRRIEEVADMIAGGKDQATARAEAKRLLAVRAGP